MDGKRPVYRLEASRDHASTGITSTVRVAVARAAPLILDRAEGGREPAPGRGSCGDRKDGR